MSESFAHGGAPPALAGRELVNPVIGRPGFLLA
jgi:hypothetical protein